MTLDKFVNREAEVAVLAALICEPTTAEQVVGIIEPTDFYSTGNALIFGAIESLYARRCDIDYVTLATELKQRGELDRCGGVAYLTNLADTPGTSAGIHEYVRILKANARRRALYTTCAAAIEHLADEATPIDGIVSDLLATARASLPIDDVMAEDFAELIPRFAEMMQARKDRRLPYVFCGMHRMDIVLGYMQPSQMVTVGGRTSTGKTSLMLSMMLHMSKTEPCTFLSAEMGSMELMEKMAANLAHIDSLTFKVDAQEVDQVKVLTALSSTSRQIKIVQTSRFRRERIERIISVTKPRVLFVDYIQRFSVPVSKDSRASAFSDIANDLKAIAMEHNILVIAGSQLNRESEYRKTKEVTMADLKESGGIEEASDKVILIQPLEKGTFGDKVRLIVAKNRQGMTGEVDVLFNKPSCEFIEANAMEAQ